MSMFGEVSFEELVKILVQPIPPDDVNPTNYQQNLGYVYPAEGNRLKISRKLGCNFEELAAKLLANNIYVLPTGRFPNDTFYVEPVKLWGEWKKGRCFDNTGLKANSLVLGWFYGGTTLIVKTKSSQAAHNGIYRLVEFECKKLKGRNEEYAKIVAKWDCLGQIDPYSYFLPQNLRYAIFDLEGSIADVKMRRRRLFRHLFSD